jgi:hypothetical protein
VKELGGESLVVRKNERRAIEVLDHFRHSKGFAGAGDAEQDLMLFAGMNTVEKFFDGAALIAARLVVTD